MDPLFGLPTMKDTKAMDAARARNKSYERHLVRTISTLDSEMKANACKLQHTVSDLHQFMVNINPNTAKTVIYPHGMSDEEKHNYRVLRRGSLPSMSLDEFDVRMKVKLEKRHAQTRRRNRPEVDKEVEKIVDVDAHSFCAPFHKHRQTMREAYDRATSNDVRFSETKNDRFNKTDSHYTRSKSTGGIVSHPVRFNVQIPQNGVTEITNRKRDGHNHGNTSSLNSRLLQMIQRGVNNLDSSEDED